MMKTYPQKLLRFPLKRMGKYTFFCSLAGAKRRRESCPKQTQSTRRTLCKNQSGSLLFSTDKTADYFFEVRDTQHSFLLARRRTRFARIPAGIAPESSDLFHAYKLRSSNGLARKEVVKLRTILKMRGKIIKKRL